MDKAKIAELFRKADFYASTRDARRSLTNTEDESWYMRSTFCMPSRYVPWDEVSQHNVIQAMIAAPSPAALRMLREYIEGLQNSKRLATFADKTSPMLGLGVLGREVTKPKVPKRKMFLHEDTFRLALALGAISWHYIQVGDKHILGAFRARKLLMFAGPIIQGTGKDAGGYR